jgi:plasmid stabilization system protein ParE
MKLEWSAAAIVDLQRFALFLEEHHPKLAQRIAAELRAKALLLEANPQLGYALSGGYRQVVLRVLGARYVLRYRLDGERIIVVRVFHGREAR